MKKKIELLPPTEMWQVLEERKNQLQTILLEIEKECDNCKKYIQQKSQCPDFDEKYTLNVSISHGITQYYLHQKQSPGKTKYLPVSQKDLIQNLLQRDYLKKVGEFESKELKKINDLLAMKTGIPELLNSMAAGRKMHIQPVTLPDSDYIQNWQQISYTPKPFSPNDPQFYTSKGLRVRSKSEIIIATVLDTLHIPYKYEYPVHINQKSFHPDFYCLNVRTRQEYLWEHFGMMDNPEYSKKALEKLRLYNQSGYFTGKNLITTFELSDYPINTQQIKLLVTQYLL